ncbi:MAG: hypothetical protein WC684_03420 [Hyphomicrobium sp.]
MSSLFDVPAQLAMLLSLAASSAAPGPTAAVLVTVVPADVMPLAEPLEGPLRLGERSWLRALHEDPAEAEAIAGRVFVTSGGRYYVPTAADRNRILEARADPAIATRVARAAAERNAARMHAVLHQRLTAGDLYIAHVFGAEAAISLLTAAGEAPEAELQKRFPALAASTAGIEPGLSAPVTVGQFYRRLAGAVSEPPRLVAIGLRPTLAEEPRRIAVPEESATVDWQANVNVAKADRRTQ